MSDAEANLLDAIEQSYSEFADMPCPRSLDASPLRDGRKILKTLTSTSLRDLGGDELGPYSGWAMTTVGNGDDYRHFLPRIFELAVKDPVWMGMKPEILASKMNLAEWRSWPSKQQASVLRFFRAAFRAALNKHPDQGESAEDWLCGLMILGEPPSGILSEWMASTSINAKLQLASLVVDEGRRFDPHEKAHSGFWDNVSQDLRREMDRMITSDQARSFLQSAARDVSDEEKFYLLDPALAAIGG